MLNVRDVATKARRAIGDPTYESVSRELAYDIVWRQQQMLINHAKRSRQAWLTRTIAVDINGSNEGYPLPDDFGGIYNATYDPQFYSQRSFPDIDVVSGTGLDEIDSEPEAVVTPGAIAGFAVRFDADSGQNSLVARPRNRSAHVLLEYVPGLWPEGTPSDRIVVISAFQTTLLVHAVALEMLQSARWDGIDEPTSAARSQRYTDGGNPMSLANQYQLEFRQFDRYIFNPNTVGTSYQAKGFGYRRR